METKQTKAPSFEKQAQAQERKLSYDELKRTSAEIYQQYQKLMKAYREAQEQLANRDFEFTSFFLQACFKVIEHPEQYSKDFAPWCAGKIEDMLKKFDEASQSVPEEVVPSAETEQSGETA